MRTGKYISFLLILAVSLTCVAQQLPRYTQHMFIKSAINPAVTGSEKFVEMGASHRTQWRGFDGAPRTQILYAHSSINNKNYGIGGYFFNDRFGPIQNTGISGSYAYHIVIQEDIKISMGVAGSLAQFSVNGNDIRLDDETDELIDLTTISSTMVPEAAAGLYLYSPVFYGGFSVMNLTQNKVKVFKNLGTNSVAPYMRHYYVMGGARLGISEDFALIPSVLINKAGTNPLQTDINIRAATGIFEFGTSYRTNDAFAILTNISFIDYLEVSYSFDILTSKLSSNAGVSHEFMIRYKLFYNDLYRKMYLQNRQ